MKITKIHLQTASSIFLLLSAAAVTTAMWRHAWPLGVFTLGVWFFAFGWACNEVQKDMKEDE